MSKGTGMSSKDLYRVPEGGSRTSFSGAGSNVGACVDSALSSRSFNSLICRGSVFSIVSNRCISRSIWRPIAAIRPVRSSVSVATRAESVVSSSLATRWMSSRTRVSRLLIRLESVSSAETRHADSFSTSSVPRAKLQHYATPDNGL